MWRGSTLLLIVAFILSPTGLEVLADQSAHHSRLNERMEAIWGQYNVTITYLYDANGSMIEKDVAGGNDEHTITYDYDYRQRLLRATESRNDSGTITDNITEYIYNSSGIRVYKHTWTEIDGTGQNDDVDTLYLIDPFNHTGYAQVLEEEVDNGTTTLTTYILGDDVIGKATSGVVQYYLYDGHGSVRQHAKADEALKTYQYDDGVNSTLNYNAFHYDGYGNSLVPQANDGLGYAGEMWDATIDHSYNRARYYSPSNGRWNRVDPYAGNMQDPQSLHKYLYAHNNPVNGIDPSGKFLVGLAVTSAIGSLFGAIFSPILRSITGKIADKLIPQWVRDVISRGVISAYKIKGRGSGGYGPVSITGSLIYKYKLRNEEHTLSHAFGGSAGLRARLGFHGGFSLRPGVDLGFGGSRHSVRVTVPYTALPVKLQTNIRDKILMTISANFRRYLHALDIGMATGGMSGIGPRIWAVGEVRRLAQQAGRLTSRLSRLGVTVSWSGNTKVGLSFNTSLLSLGSSPKGLSLGYEFTQQFWSSKDGFGYGND